MSIFRVRSGYIFLFSVIMIGAISLATLGSLLLIGIGSLQIGATVEQSEQARSLAQTCTERALRSLWEDATYVGNENIPLPEGECDILPVGGSGNENRAVCTEGRVGFTVRRYEILLKRILPSTQVYSWREVEQFAACTYAEEGPDLPRSSSFSFSSSSESSSDISSSSSEISSVSSSEIFIDCSPASICDVMIVNDSCMGRTITCPDFQYPAPDGESCGSPSCVGQCRQCPTLPTFYECSGGEHCSIFLMGSACLQISSYCSIGSPVFTGNGCGEGSCTGDCYICPDQGEILSSSSSSASSSSF